MTHAKLLQFFDATYDVEQPRDAWLKGVLQSVERAFDRGAGVGGVLYEISGDDQLQVDTHDALGCSSDWHEVGIAVHRDSRFIPAIVRGYRSTLCATLAELPGNKRAVGSVQREVHRPHGMLGQVVINGFDVSGHGCALYLFAHDPIELSAAQRDLFNRLAIHLASAYRLQRRMAAGEPAKSASLEAVLTPDGRVEHTQALAQSQDARQSLKLAVQRRERARSTKAREAERVVRSLKGLVDSRWTLLDQYEHGGRRYVFARENTPRPFPTALSQREQQVAALAALGRSNKLIAYELGLAHSTVRVLLARACAKIGVSTRAELIARYLATASS